MLVPARRRGKPDFTVLTDARMSGDCRGHSGLYDGGMTRHRALSLSAILLCLLCLLAQAGHGQQTRTPLGINLSGPSDWNEEHPFVDVFRLSRKWISQREGEAWGKGPRLELDDHGWVKSLEPGCYAETPIVTHGHHPSGVYTVLHEGLGKLAFNGDARVTDQQAGRTLIETKGEGAIFIQLRETDPSNPLRNIRVLMPGHEESYREEPWNPDFLKRWRGVAVLRFMDFMHTNNSPLEKWEDRPQLDDATWTGPGGIPIEMLCDLATRLGADPWFCMPHLADDEFVRQFARLVKDRLPPERTVWIEYSNEVWNGMFSQARHAQQTGLKLGLAEKEWEAGWRYTALRSLEIFKIWEEVFEGSDRLKRTLATQAANSWISERICGTQDSGKHADALAIAPYISFNVNGEEAPKVAALGVGGILDRVEQEKLPQSIQWMREQKQVADMWGLELVAYEAGQHLVGVAGGEGHQGLTQAFVSANRHPRMGTIYKRYLEAWAEVSDHGLICLFSSCGNWGKWGSWGLLEHANQKPADSPKYRSTMRWAAKHGNPVKAP